MVINLAETNREINICSAGTLPGAPAKDKVMLCKELELAYITIFQSAG